MTIQLTKTALVAGVLAAGLLAWSSAAQDVTAPGQLRTATCAPGFSNSGQFAGGAQFDYECRTPLIKCPPRADYLVFTAPAPPIESASGLRLRYRCSYQKKPG